MRHAAVEDDGGLDAAIDRVEAVSILGIMPPEIVPSAIRRARLLDA